MEPGRECLRGNLRTFKLIIYGFVGSVVLSLLIVVTSSYYVEIFQVEESVKLLTRQILIAYAVIAPFKVENMILGGGIIRLGISLVVLRKKKWMHSLEAEGTA